jgi:hypothetical protein
MNKKQLTAAGKILRRCTICKKFHASYLVDDPELGKCYLCYSCWKSKQDASNVSREENESKHRLQEKEQ